MPWLMKWLAGLGLMVAFVVLVGVLPGQCVRGQPSGGVDPYDACVSRGEVFFRDAGMAVVDGRRAADVVRERCVRNAGAFGT